MKTISILLFLISSGLFASTGDTTLNVDLNFDGKKETVKLTHKGEEQDFTLQINDAVAKAKFEYAYGSDIQIIDINRNDNLMEVIVKGYGNSDQSDMFFFQYVDGNIVKCGHLPSNFGVDTDGSGVVTEHGWMGFWTIKFRYQFDTKRKTLTRLEEEFYEVNQECEVKNPFKLLAERNDNSETVVTLKPKTKLVIVKADIGPKCKTPEGYPDDFFCDWYYFRTEDGKEGWVRLRDFQENVDGLIWAG